MQRITLLSAVVLALCCYGCASSGPKEVKKLPGWYENPPDATETHLFAVAVAESRDMQVAVKKAKTLCRADLAQQLAVKVQNLEKLFQEEVGTDADSELLEQFTSATKAVTSETLHGVEEVEKELQNLEEGSIRTFVLMSLPIGAANQALMAKLKANEHLYTRFRATQAFEELDAEIKAYEASGKDM